MRSKWFGGSVVIVASALALGCGAESPASVEEPFDDTESEVGETTQAVQEGFQAFVSVNAAGVKQADFSFNSVPGGVIVTSKNAGLGSYLVRLGGMAAGGVGGNVQVVAQGLDNVRCKALSSGFVGNIFHIEVRCFAPNGLLADSGFIARYAKAPGLEGFGRGAYLTIANPAAERPDVIASWNSEGGPNTVLRTRENGQLTTGRYTVILTTMPMVGGAVQVTATGNGADHCKVAEWLPQGGAQVVDVRCFRGAAPVNTTFSLNFMAHPNTVGIRDRGAFVWAHDIGAVDYVPDTRWSQNTGHTAGRCSAPNRAGVDPTTRIYSIRHEDMPAFGSPHVTAYGTDATYCKVHSMIGALNDSFSIVRTRCFTSAGVATFSQYAETYATKDSPGPC